MLSRIFVLPHSSLRYFAGCQRPCASGLCDRISFLENPESGKPPSINRKPESPINPRDWPFLVTMPFLLERPQRQGQAGPQPLGLPLPILCWGNSFERDSIPMSAIRSSFVGALQKFDQDDVGVRRLAQGFVGKDEFAEVLVVAA